MLFKFGSLLLVKSKPSVKLLAVPLLQGCALQGPLQGLIERGPGSFVLRLRDAPLFVLHFELEQLILQGFEKQPGTI
jgi:hypothetical protein